MGEINLFHMNAKEFLVNTIYMTKLKRFWALNCCLFIGFVSYINIAQANNNNLSTNQTVNLQLKWRHQFQFAGYYAAQQQGFFKKNGLLVNIIEGDNIALAANSVESGVAQYGVSDSEILIDFLKSKKIVVIAAIFQHSPYVLISLKESNISQPADLIGKRIMFAGNQGANEFKLMLHNGGIGVNQIKIAKESWDMVDLMNHKVDVISGYISAQPNTLKALGVNISHLKYVNNGIDYYGDTLFTSTKEANEHPQRVEAFLKATQDGWLYALSHREQIADYILTLPGVKERGISKQQLLAEANDMEPLILPDVVEIGHMNPARWQHILQGYATLGLVNKDADLSNLIFVPKKSTSILSKATLISSVIVLASLIGLFTLWVYNSRRKINIKLGKINVEVALREEAEANLKSSQQYINQMFRATKAGIAVANIDGSYVLANTAYCNILGYTEAELRSKSVESLIYKEDKFLYEENFKGITRKNIKDFTIEKRLNRADGTQIWVRASISAMQNVNDETSHFIIVAEDISERIDLQSKLNQKEQLLSIASKMAKVGGWHLNVINNELTWSEAINTMRELPSGTRTTLEDGINFYLPEDREKIRQLVINSIKYNLSYQGEFQQITATGKRIWIRTIGEPIADKNGKVIAIQGAFQDITDQKKLALFNAKQADILKKIAFGAPILEVLHAIVSLVEDQFPDVLCSIHLVDNTGTKLMRGISVKLSQTYLNAIGDFEIANNNGSCGTAAYSRSQIIVSDIANDPIWAVAKDIALEHNLKSCWSQAIVSNKNLLLGTFGVYSRKVHSPSEEEIDLIKSCACIVGIALEAQIHHETY